MTKVTKAGGPEPDRRFNGVKVFSATMWQDRAVLGDRVTEWLTNHPAYELADIVVAQSSDQAFHCLSITIFYRDPEYVARLFPAARRLAFEG